MNVNVVSAGTGQLDLMVSEWMDQIAGATGVVLITDDGLVRAYSSSLHPDVAQSLAAVMSGLRACARGIGETAQIGMPKVSVLEMTGGWAFVQTAAPGTLLGVITTPTALPAEVADRMQQLVGRITRHLATAPRPAVPGSS